MKFLAFALFLFSTSLYAQTVTFKTDAVVCVSETSFKSIYQILLDHDKEAFEANIQPGADCMILPKGVKAFIDDNAPLNKYAVIKFRPAGLTESAYTFNQSFKEFKALK